MISSVDRPTSGKELYIPREVWIRREVARNKYKFRQKEAASKTALFLIDEQNDFCLPTGSLYVAGAEQDTARLCTFFYDNMEKIDAVYCSLDTHAVKQIFFSSYWSDTNGNPPEPYTVITATDIREEKWKASGGQYENDIALAYVEALERQGNFSLIIWPFHTMKGSLGQALVSELSEALLYYSLISGRSVSYKEKGQKPYTENFSVLSPEVQRITVGNEELVLGSLDLEFMEQLLAYDQIYIAGQASSHCVRATIEDMLQFIKAKGLGEAAAKKIFILEDCMSSVTAPGIDFPALTAAVFQQFAAEGMNLVKSTKPV